MKREKFPLFLATLLIFLAHIASSIDVSEGSNEGSKLETKFIKSTDWVDYTLEVPCQSFDELQGKESMTPECLTQNCARRVVDGIFDQADVDKLLAIANKGMSQRTDFGGPTILDINTGYIRDSKGLDNLFMKGNDIYSADDFAHYGKIINKLKETVMETFHIPTLHFTAPTFITRINSDLNWKPLGIHDEYWHPHVDMNNTLHYQYSGLLYLSTYNEDFTGGRIHFVDAKEHDHFDSTFQEDLSSKFHDYSSLVELSMEPRAGRVIIFSSGIENTHFVEQVTSGKRFVLSFWFSCDVKKEFQIFLDGNAHVTFSHKFREKMLESQTKTNHHYAKKSAASKKQPPRPAAGPKKEL